MAPSSSLVQDVRFSFWKQGFESPWGQIRMCTYDLNEGKLPTERLATHHSGSALSKGDQLSQNGYLDNVSSVLGGPIV